MRGVLGQIVGMQIICAGLALPLRAETPSPPPRAAHAPPRGPARAQELVQQYLAAAGVAGLRAVHTRACQGEVERTPSGTAASAGLLPFQGRIELDWKEPGGAREVWTNATSKQRRITDGQRGWEVGTGESRRELSQGERVELSRLAALYQPALVLPLDELTLLRSDKVDGRPAFVLQSKGGELLWLDQESHLPLRVDLLVERPEPSRAGEFDLTQIFFADWQPVLPEPTAGATTAPPASPILLPRTLRRVLAQGTIGYRFTSVKQDVDLSNGLFKIPYFWRK